MSRSITERYDDAADRYGRWWAPVLSPTAVALLDRVEARLGGRLPEHVVDLGAGTGTLALAALRRWPASRVTAVDGSAGMVAAAEAEARARLGPSDLDRLHLLVAMADDVPLPDGAADVVVSSFVLQLVPSRPRVLREVRRLLRPGGLLAYVTWLDGRADEAWLPDEAFDQAIEDAAIEEDAPVDGSAGADLPSAAAAGAQVRRAGFRDVTAEEGEVRYAWTATSYLDFLEQYDEFDLFTSLDPAARARLHEAARRRLGALAPADFEWRAPVVTVLASRPGRPGERGRTG